MKNNNLTELEKAQLDAYEKYLRLCAPRKIYTLSEAAFLLHCSRNEINSIYIDKGLLKVTKRGKKFFIKQEEIERCLDSLPDYISKKAVDNYSINKVKFINRSANV